MSGELASSKPAQAEGSAIPMPGGGEISKLLKSQGPVVTAVLLKAGPEAEVTELQIDTTPQRQMVKEVLGGAFTFLGQYEEEGTVLMCRKDSDDNLAQNCHTLQPPFDASTVNGDILILKVAADDDEEADISLSTIAAKSNEEFFLNYSKDEYTNFAARTDVVVPAAVSMEDSEAEGEEEESDAEEMEGESDEEDEDGAAGFLELLMGQVLAKFQADNGRLPDETELAALKSAISEKMAGLGH